MKKLLTVVIASAFAFGSVSVFAADAVKKEELTKEQREEMRIRAAKLQEQRPQIPVANPGKREELSKEQRDELRARAQKLQEARAHPASQEMNNAVKAKDHDGKTKNVPKQDVKKTGPAA